jgi:predicted ABC-type exoprotein transport system permease subunit
LHDRRSLVVGLVVPAVAILVVMPLLADSDVHVAGVPLLFFWIFAWFPLTSLCLWIAWRIDEPRYRDESLPPRGEVG